MIVRVEQVKSWFVRLMGLRSDGDTASTLRIDSNDRLEHVPYGSENLPFDQEATTGEVRNVVLGHVSGSPTEVELSSSGKFETVIYGNDSGGNEDPLRTNASQQLQVEIVNQYTAGTPAVAQAAPAMVNTEEVLYTVPSSTKVRVLRISIADESGGAVTFRVGISVGGGALVSGEYLYYDTAIAANEVVVDADDFWLNATDEIRIEGSSTTMSFSVLVMEFPA